MRLATIDLGDYMHARRRMRLLLNLLDFGLAYSLFRPVLRADAVLRPLARAKGEPLGAMVLDVLSSGPAMIATAVGAFLLYTLVAIVVAVSITAKIKSLVRSDSRWTVAAFGVLFLALALAWLIGLPTDLPVRVVIATFPAAYAYAAFTHLWRLRRLAKNPLYRRLVGVRRRSFAFASTRYAFFSLQSLRVYLTILSASWRVYVAYVGLGVLVLSIAAVPHTALARRVADWLETLPIAFSLVLGIIAFFLAVWIIASGRRFVANETVRFLRQLRSRVARSASAVARADTRPPILFLRSFGADEIAVKSDRYWGARFLAMRDQEVRLEEVIAETLYPYGPLVALANPKDRLPPLGAARENVADPDWQQAVDRYMADASRIVLIVGDTPSLRWEARRIVAMGYLEKCLVVFPPSYHTAAGARLTNCLPELGEALGFRSTEDEAAALSEALVLAGVGRADAAVITAREKTQMDYAEVLRLSVQSDALESVVAPRVCA